MDLHQLPGSLYSSPQFYSVTARGLDQDPSSCSADDKMIEKLICTLPYRTENTPLYLYPQHGPSLQIFAWRMPLLVYVISSLYNAAVSFSRRRCEISKIGLFFWLNFAICKGRQIKTTIAYTWPVSSLVYKTISNCIHWMGTRRIWCQFSKYGQ